LRDTIYDLPKLQFSYVETEYKISNKSADIFYIDDTNPLFQSSIAIECKDWLSGLTSSDLRGIYSEYFPSLNSNEIDRVIIIGRKELNKEPQETLRGFQKFTYVTFDKFVTSLMNFSYLLHDNILAFKNHDASANFLSSTVMNERMTV